MLLFSGPLAHHVGLFPGLEDQMTEDSEGTRDSSHRLKDGRHYLCGCRAAPI